MSQHLFKGKNLTVPEGYRTIALDSIDSTNEESRRRIEAGEATDFWVVAAEQTKGRGRRGRAWVSAPGNLFCSLVVTPHVPMAEAAQLSFVTALAVHDALRALLPDQVHLNCKWPNDILLSGKKVAGILLEAAPGGDSRTDYGTKTGQVIIGIGVNIANFPEEVAFPATSLNDEGLGDQEVADVFEAIAGFFADWRLVWQQAGFAAIRNAWKDRAAGLGREIFVRLENGTLQGVFRDLDERGQLLLAGPDGNIVSISAGDVFFAAPSGASK